MREAQADLAAGRSDKAQREFEDLLARDPRELAAIRGRIEAARKRGALEPLLREMSQRSELRKAGERNDGTRDALELCALGLAEFAAGNEAAAVTALRRAVELRPERQIFSIALAPAHALLDLAAARLDEAGRAVTELRRAAELAPDLPQPHAWLAELYEAKQKPELAAAEYAAALERNPLDPETLRHLGMLRLDRGLPNALEPLEQASLLQSDDDGCNSSSRGPRSLPGSRCRRGSASSGWPTAAPRMQRCCCASPCSSSTSAPVRPARRAAR